jgi:P27 family predicted phage terminase small subunit
MKVLTEADLVMLARLCELLEEYLELRQLCEKQKFTKWLKSKGNPEEGTTDTYYIQIAPWMSQRDKIWKEIRSISQEFGMTPSSRAGISISGVSLTPQTGLGSDVRNLLYGK